MAVSRSFILCKNYLEIVCRLHCATQSSVDANVVQLPGNFYFVTLLKITVTMLAWIATAAPVDRSLTGVSVQCTRSARVRWYDQRRPTTMRH